MSQHTTSTTTADRVAMYVGGGLVVLGVFVIGLLEMLLGAKHPVTSEGQIAHDALIDPGLRAAIILAGFLVWGLYAAYKLVGTTPSSG
ncbi:MAG: hypothetical protein ABEJ42_02395 [Halobacteriaceae archaeon]